MKNTLTEINIIFQLVSTIPVTGDSVETMAAVRSKLRNVYGYLNNMSETKEEVQANAHTEVHSGGSDN